jgi:chitinase
MQPEQIPVDGLTHVNYAFAYIDPENGGITTMDNTTLDSLFSRVTDIKLRNPALKVWVSIGGWAFNDDGPYQSVFGSIAASLVQSRILAAHLLSFCGYYPSP